MTSTTDNVYAIVNLPEEVVAVIFAYVSRSPLSFRDNLVKLLHGDELAVGDWIGQAGSPAVQEAAAAAQAFHERWVVGYGHASVAEHATVHLGIERISRLGSAALELANPFLSFTEYSQRYQEPQRGEYYRPTGLEGSQLKLYDRVLDNLYDDYLEIQEGIVRHLDRTETRREEAPERRMRRFRRSSFEDARYALPLAMETNLGLTGNARALRDAIVVLLSSPHGEDQELGAAMRKAAGAVAPTLLRHADPSVALGRRPVPPRPNGELPPITLLRADDGSAVLREMAQAIRPGQELRERSDSELVAILRETLPYGPFDPAPACYHFAHYSVRFNLSEAAWHQLLRHRRAMEFSAAEPGIGGGFVVPPLVRAAGVESVLRRAQARVAEAVRELGEDHPAARYLVLNAHRRPVHATLDLGQVCHLIRQRGKADAQWEIREAAHALHGMVREVHPFVWLPPADGGE